MRVAAATVEEWVGEDRDLEAVGMARAAEAMAMATPARVAVAKVRAAAEMVAL